MTRWKNGARVEMSDYIKREDALDIVAHNCVNGEITLNRYDKIIDGIYEIPPADVAPVGQEEDGTLWVTVGDCEKVGRVIVKNEQGHLCRVFYMGDGDEEPVRHGHWIYNQDDMTLTCSYCGDTYNIDDVDGGLDFMENAKYCISCGTLMDGDENEDA